MITIAVHRRMLFKKNTLNDQSNTKALFEKEMRRQMKAMINFELVINSKFSAIPSTTS